MYCNVFHAIAQAMIPATDPATVAMMVILSLVRPPPLPPGAPEVDDDVEVGEPGFPMLPGVAAIVHGQPDYSSHTDRSSKALPATFPPPAAKVVVVLALARSTVPISTPHLSQKAVR